ncbi:MAG: isopenicillin N synthase family oxygenase [Verrucomicrobiales bacterium]|nr:isopenicillin N synthase family oxygenase [Verrucomicrobiales bacterium]
MATLVTLDASALRDGAPGRAGVLRDLDDVCRDAGFFLLRNHGIPGGLWEAMLEVSVRFFERPAEEKEAIDLRGSSNFRGFSRMKNLRDWREQLHWGWEWPQGAWTEGRPEYYRLAGGNPWPDPAFALVVSDYMKAAQGVGLLLLRALAGCLSLPTGYFDPSPDEPPYLLLKQICYYPQSGSTPRSGVAPHCDWSWITLLLQDATGGLEVQDSRGDWLPVPAEPGVLAVNTGELLEILTRGRYRAAPHRVINPGSRRRISVPTFINPPLAARVEPLEFPGAVPDRPIGPPGADHVHRVVPRGVDCGPFTFGESEWRRKGMGLWCHDAQCRGA